MISSVTEKAFKDATGVSYSRISKLADGPQSYLKGLADEPDSSAIALGTVVDMKLTQPAEAFDEQVYVMTTDIPKSEMMKTFCEVYAETDDQGIARESSGFKIGIDAVVKKFEKEGKEYYNALLKAKGKTIIGAENFFRALNMVKILRSNPYTSRYFVNETPGIELMFQVPILWTIDYKSLMQGEEGKVKTINAKSLLDVIRIDNNNKVIQPIELKTGADSFYKSYRRYKRILQGTMYYDAVAQTVQKSGDHKDYTVEPLRFIYADSNLVYPPAIYKMAETELDAGREGRLNTIQIDKDEMWIHLPNKVFKVKGYKRLIAELEWHEKNDMWDYSYDVYQNNGEIDLDTVTTKL